MKISRTANAVKPSLTRKLYDLAKQYDDTIDLTLGDPDISPNVVIKEAACEAIMSGKTRYSANAGLLSLREVLARQFEKEYGLSVDPTRNLIVTIGGMEALFLALQCLIDTGDEVIVPAPYYVNYVQMVRMCGGVPIIINTTEESGFLVSAEQIEQAITSKTVAIILNTPSNPTGQLIDGSTLDKIAKVVVKNDLAVISDEVYKTLIFDDRKHESIVTRPGMEERTIVVDSLSKRFAMTGYRIGYAFAPQDMIESMTKLQENVAACAPLPSQYAAISAYLKCSDDEGGRDLFGARCKYMYEAVKEIPQLSCTKPAATFYLFVNIEKTGLDSFTFAQRLLEKQHVAVAPGITYGEAYDGYIRIACTLDIVELEKAVERLQRFVAEL